MKPFLYNNKYFFTLHIGSKEKNRTGQLRVIMLFHDLIYFWINLNLRSKSPSSKCLILTNRKRKKTKKVLILKEKMKSIFLFLPYLSWFVITDCHRNILVKIDGNVISFQVVLREGSFMNDVTFLEVKILWRQC